MSPRHDDQRMDWRDERPADRRPMADEPHSFIDSWVFLIPLGLMCIGILLWQAGVLRP